MRRARLLLVLLTGCAYELPPDGSYYDERIGPTLRESCGITTSGCHLADERGRAMGNLDVGSYDALMRRQDALVPYGPYPRPLLLLKASEPVEVAVDTLDGTVNVVTDIRHGGGVNFEQGSRTFRELVRWLDAGFSRTGAPIDRGPAAQGECLPGAGRAAGFSAEKPAARPA
ncbi:MAG TPA: hypothetical protein PKD64_12570, partial [Pirellulaceae bacterium]|nr:hypothetical protein [Pirellulaceae bacterium]